MTRSDLLLYLFLERAPLGRDALELSPQLQQLLLALSTLLLAAADPLLQLTLNPAWREVTCD